MKTKLLISFVLSVAFMTLLAQTSSKDSTSVSTKKIRFCELGMNVYYLDYRLIDYYYGYESRELNNYFCTGFYFKRFSGRDAFRSSLNYLQRASDYKGSQYNTGGITGISSYKAGDLKVGYQRLFGSKRFSPYFFADLHYTYSRESFSQPYYDPYLYSRIDYIGPYYPAQSFSTDRHQLGIIKGLGLRWNVADRLVLNLETSFEYYCYTQHETKSSQYKRRNIGLTFHPVIFSVGFKF